jgi:dCTP deaminase
MTFWSSQKIEANLARLTDHPDPDMVDCNALTLRVGGEVYITPGLEQSAPSSHTKKQLAPTEPIAIPPGQFAFLLTEETITIPPEVMGLISIKASFKMRGLVNVSGFHVDPGWSGPLIFTVFNAGPATVHLERGLPVFLLWIADLEEASNKRKTKAGWKGIPPAIISNITGVVDSIYALEKRLKEDVKAVADKQDSFRDQIAEVKERQSKVLLYFGLAAVVAGAIVGVGVKMFADYAFPATPPVIVAPAPPPTQVLVPRPIPAESPPALPAPAGNTAAAKDNGS